MLTKTRTALITLAAVASIGGSVIVPTSSQAQAMTPWELGQVCDSLQFDYNGQLELGVKAAGEGRYAEALQRFANAAGDKSAAEFNGCKWPFSTLAPVTKAPPVAVSPSRVAVSMKA